MCHVVADVTTWCIIKLNVNNVFKCSLPVEISEGLIYTLAPTFGAFPKIVPTLLIKFGSLNPSIPHWFWDNWFNKIDIFLLNLWVYLFLLLINIYFFYTFFKFYYYYYFFLLY